MNITRYVLITLFLVFMVAGRLASAAEIGTADSMSDEQILQRFVLMNPKECSKPKIKPPPLPATTFFEGDSTTTTNDIGSSYRDRFYLDLDGDGVCEILDVWIDRVTPDPDDYRLMGMSAIYKYQKKHWINEGSVLPCKPKYQIFDRKNKTIYYLVDFDGDLYKPVDGIYYLDGGWETREAGMLGGMSMCSADFVCKGVDFKHVAEVLLKKKEPAETNKAESNK
jgi:hypothetical protein